MGKLSIDTSLLVLEAWHFRSKDFIPSNPPEGAFAVRGASGGAPPYSYRTSNPEIAQVNDKTGKVISHGNGKATIIVKDREGETAEYFLQASNVDLLFGTGVFNTYTQCKEAAEKQKGQIPSLEQWRSYIENYRGTELQDEWCWTSDPGSVNMRWAINRQSGDEEERSDFGWGGHTANGFGIRPA